MDEWKRFVRESGRSQDKYRGYNVTNADIAIHFISERISELRDVSGDPAITDDEFVCHDEIARFIEDLSNEEKKPKLPTTGTDRFLSAKDGMLTYGSSKAYLSKIGAGLYTAEVIPEDSAFLSLLEELLFERISEALEVDQISTRRIDNETVEILIFANGYGTPYCNEMDLKQNSTTETMKSKVDELVAGINFTFTNMKKLLEAVKTWTEVFHEKCNGIIKSPKITFLYGHTGVLKGDITLAARIKLEFNAPNDFLKEENYRYGINAFCVHKEDIFLQGNILDVLQSIKNRHSRTELSFDMITARELLQDKDKAAKIIAYLKEAGQVANQDKGKPLCTPVNPEIHRYFSENSEENEPVDQICSVSDGLVYKSVKLSQDPEIVCFLDTMEITTSVPHVIMDTIKGRSARDLVDHPFLEGFTILRYRTDMIRKDRIQIRMESRQITLSEFEKILKENEA